MKDNSSEATMKDKSSEATIKDKYTLGDLVNYLDHLCKNNGSKNIKLSETTPIIFKTANGEKDFFFEYDLKQDVLYIFESDDEN